MSGATEDDWGVPVSKKAMILNSKNQTT